MNTDTLQDFKALAAPADDEEKKPTLTEIAVEYEERDEHFTPDYLTQLGQFTFTKMAIEDKDAKMWTGIQEIILKREKLALDRLKLEHDIETERAARKTKEDDLTHEEKQIGMKKIMGIQS